MTPERPTLLYAITRVLIACCLWVLVLMLSSTAAMGLMMRLPDLQWLAGFVMQAGILVFSLALIMILGKGKFGRFGFTRPAVRLFWPVLIFGLTLGAATAVVEGFAGAGEHPAMANLTFVQIVLVIWIWASLCEEVLHRGLIQGYLAPLAERGVTVCGVRISLPVAVSAVLFSVMHLMLITMGMSLAAVIPLLIFTLLLGGAAGYFREKTGSLLPAILVHFFGNLAGTLVGYIV